MTPHNFTLPDAEFGLDTDVDIAAGETVEVHLNPLWPVTSPSTVIVGFFI